MTMQDEPVRRGVTILGSTGTIGVNTLDVLARHPQAYRVVALTANDNVERLAQQCRDFRPDYAVVVSADGAERLERELAAEGLPTRVLCGAEALVQVAALPETDYVMAGIVGAAGLMPTLAAARAGKRVMLANKEALVMSGQLFMDEIHASGAELLPIDSEHNAIFQCMPADFARGLDRVGVERILLTASGGPFRTLSPEALAGVTPEQACAHPNWVMGRKISVDSATMMNKGLEVIEACWLFGTGTERVEVVLHPQSVIHSMVSYSDGSVLAQLGNPDMRPRSPTPWPGRSASPPGWRPWTWWPSPDWTSSVRIWGVSPACDWPTRPSRWAVPPPPCSTPPTRWRSRPSWTAGWPSRTSPR